MGPKSGTHSNREFTDEKITPVAAIAIADVQDEHVSSRSRHDLAVRRFALLAHEIDRHATYTRPMGERITYVLLAGILILAIACDPFGSGDSGDGDVASGTSQEELAAYAFSSNLPGAPEIVSVTPGDGFATISWRAPSNGPESTSDASVVNRYVVTGFPDGLRSLDGDVLSVRMGGLSNGQEYTFTVRAANEAGFGPDSGSSQSILVAAPPGPPPAVAVTGLLEGGVQLAWRAPARDGGSGIVTYVINSETRGATLVLEGEPTAGYAIVGTPDRVTRPGLADGGSMVFVIDLGDAAPTDRFRVAAANERGLGQWSSWTQIISGVLEVSSQVPESDGASNTDQGVSDDGSSPTEAEPSQQQEPESTPGTPVPGPSTPPVTETPTPDSGIPEPAEEPTGSIPTTTPVPNTPGAVITVRWLPMLYGDDGPPPGWDPVIFGQTGTPFLLDQIEAWSSDPVDVFRADISWGDGTTSQGWFEDPVYISSRTTEGVGQLFAYHTYSDPGRFTVTITVSAINHSGVSGQTVIEAMIDQ
jgi:hypothetical protein